MSENVDKLLHRTLEFESAIAKFIELEPSINTERVTASRMLVALSLEHSISFNILTAHAMHTSAISLIRLQFEALVRAMWATYSAKDFQVELMVAELSEESAKKGAKLPMVAQMLTQLKDDAPVNAVTPLLEFQNYQWKELNSFLHSGIHAVYRSSRGYPEKLIEQTIKTRNGLYAIAAILIAVLSGKQNEVKALYRLVEDYLDCFIAKKSNSMGQ